VITLGSKSIWNLPQAPSPDLREQFPELSLGQLQVLARRELTDRGLVQAFLGGRSPAGHDPFLLSGMQQAVDRIQAAARAGERVEVFADYDADGVCAAVLLVAALERMGVNATVYLPDRFQEGYGLNRQGLSIIRRRGVSLVVSVDCGIRSIDEASWAAQLGLDLIITDHHPPGDMLPEALAVINPKQQGDRYPFRELAGVGVAYKLACALAQAQGAEQPEDLLELVALGAVADVVPLVKENRWLVQQGLQGLRQTGRPGLRALMEISGTDPQSLDAQAIAFRLAPRLNAAGRMKSAEAAYRLLVTENQDEARELANHLQDMNRERQRMTGKLAEQASRVFEGMDPLPTILLVMGEEYHQGLLGLVAARLVERFYRPAVVGCSLEGEVRASARSIPELHITRILDGCQAYLSRYGGHSAAAGMTLPLEQWSPFSRHITQLVEVELEGEQLTPSVQIDGVVELSELDEEMMSWLEAFEPCGHENPRPLLMAEGLTVIKARAVGSEKRHLKVTVGDGRRQFDGIAFNQADRQLINRGRIDAAFYLERNEYMGWKSLQLNIQDMRSSLQ
jgi:single-stranded-DNA-specific exonuclease